VFANVESGGCAGHNVLHRPPYRDHDWCAPNVEGNGRHPSLPIRYAGVLGNALLLHIERADDQVCLGCRDCAAVIDHKHRSTLGEVDQRQACRINELEATIIAMVRNGGHSC